MYKQLIFAFLLINFSTCLARLPPRNHETEEATVDKAKDPIEAPVERSPFDIATNDDKSVNSDKSIVPKKQPIIILFRHQSPFSIFSNRASSHQSPFSSGFSPPFLNHHHHHLDSDLNEDPSIKLISLLFGNRRFRPMNFEPSETEAVNASSESSAESSELDNRRNIHPLDISSLFPNIFTMPKFPLDDETEKEGEAATSNEEKTPTTNFENKEKKVISIEGKKYVKTVQTKKVKNPFGHFHSVISSYEPFDEKIHDENGNEKIKPEETDEKVSSVDKKDVETSTVASEKIDSTQSNDKVSEKVENASVSSSPIEKEESVTEKKLIAESLNKETDDSKNEISYKSSEIKVDQMS